MRIFWDTNLFIYLFEKNEEFYQRIADLYQEMLEQEDTLITSTLTLGELIAQPLRQGRKDIAEQYVRLLSEGERFQMITFDQRAAEYYGKIRAETSVRQPDAIQLACAVAAGTSRFVTNDSSLWKVTVPGIEEICGL